MFRMLGVSSGMVLWFTKRRQLFCWWKTYSVLSSGTDARQFLLLEQATWTCYGCGLSLCSQLVSARQFLLLEQAIWS